MMKTAAKKFGALAIATALATGSAFAIPIVAETGNTCSSAYAIGGFSLTADPNIENSTTQLKLSVLLLLLLSSAVPTNQTQR